MYAIIETGGKQYRVKPGDTIAVERVAGEPGEVLDLSRVLLLGGGGDGTRVGEPGVAGAIVRAEVVEHARGEKIIVFRYKSKVRYRRKTGHRQALTRLRITDILVDGVSAVVAASAPVEEEAPARRRGNAAAVEEPTPTSETSTAEAEMPSSAGEAGPPSEEESVVPATEREAS
jgi:large subunit ribosomal protein L21